MENNKNYPYLGKCTINGKSYVVLFTEEEYGTIVMSEFTDNPKLKFGTIGKFNEDMFEILPPDVCVRLSN
jgi:hypothetical protein